MTAAERYANANAFRAALQDRLRTSAATQDTKWIVRRRKFMAFDRLLARLFLVAPDRWLLKGAVALDFRLGDRARATVDLDLFHHENEAAATRDLIAAQSIDLGDFFTFKIERTGKLDNLEGGTAVRYRVEAGLDGRRFEFVTLDVGFNQDYIAPPDLLTGPDFFAFAGIPPIQAPTIPLETHVAEKLHAYVRVYSDGRRSTRVKDLVDLVLIADHAPFDAASLRRAIEETFASRESSAVPEALPAPPGDWATPYRAFAADTGLEPDLRVGYARAARFLDPILSETASISDHWNPTSGTWRQRG